ncbi:MAG: tetratricopeptide repeat protein, partial [Flavobacteriales bacterium]|nr:tetratricopeptide repeat protein [Flavobacteriales bacterium]
MSNRIKILLIAGLSFCCVHSFAQKNAAKGDRYFDKNLFEEAIKYYKIEVKANTDRDAKKYATSRIAECYRIIGEFELAEKSYRKILKRKQNREVPIHFLNYGQSLRSSSKYAEAKVQFEEYMKLTDNPIGQVFHQSCDSAQKWLDESLGKEVRNVRSLNTEGPEFAPVYLPGNQLVISSSREGSTKAFISFNGGIPVDHLDLYSVDANYLNQDTMVVTPAIGNLNTPLHEGPATFTKDGKEVYFTRTIKGVKNEYTNKTLSTLQVFYSKIDSTGNWSEPVSAFSFNSKAYSVGHPALSSSGDTLYYMTDMKKFSQGNTDIYYSEKRFDSVRKVHYWSSPRSTGEEVNTFGHEMFPYVADNGVLYFSSDSHPGMGQLDIFSSEVIDGRWTKIKNLKPPINSIGNDFGIVFDQNNPRGFFSSDRFNGVGAEDIYSFSHGEVMEIQLKNNSISFQDTKVFSGLKYKLVNKGTGESHSLVSSQGRFTILLENDQEYLLTEKRGFRSNNKIRIKTFSNDLTNSIEISLNPQLKPIKVSGFLTQFNRIDSVTITENPIVDAKIVVAIKDSTHNEVIGEINTNSKGFFE